MLSERVSIAADLAAVIRAMAKKLPTTAVKTTASILPEESRPGVAGTSIMRSIAGPTEQGALRSTYRHRCAASAIASQAMTVGDLPARISAATRSPP